MKEKKKLLTEQEQAESYFEKIYAELWHMPREKLLQVWHLLSKGIWAAGLPGKPHGWEDKEVHVKNLWIVPICKEIENIIGAKGCYRYEKETEGQDAGQAFDDLWDSAIIDKIEELNDKTREQRKMLLEIREELTMLRESVLYGRVIGIGIVVGYLIAKFILIFVS